MLLEPSACWELGGKNKVSLTWEITSALYVITKGPWRRTVGLGTFSQQKTGDGPCWFLPPEACWLTLVRLAVHNVGLLHAEHSSIKLAQLWSCPNQHTVSPRAWGGRQPWSEPAELLWTFMMSFFPRVCAGTTQRHWPASPSEAAPSPSGPSSGWPSAPGAPGGFRTAGPADAREEEHKYVTHIQQLLRWENKSKLLVISAYYVCSTKKCPAILFILYSYNRC